MSIKIENLHAKIVAAARRHYESQGYTTCTKPDEVRMCLQRHGFDVAEIGLPDLVLERDNQIAVVEVSVNPGQGEPFFRKLMKYRKVGKVLLLFPIDVSCIELDGVDSKLEKEIWR